MGISFLEFQTISISLWWYSESIIIPHPPFFLNRSFILIFFCLWHSFHVSASVTKTAECFAFRSNWISGFSSLISHYPAPSHWVNGNHMELCRWGNNIKLTHHIPSGMAATVMTLASRRKGTGRVLRFNLLVALIKHLWFILKYNTLCFREGILFYVLQG